MVLCHKPGTVQQPCPFVKCSDQPPTFCACRKGVTLKKSDPCPPKCILFQNACQYGSFNCPSKIKYSEAPERLCDGLSVYKGPFNSLV